MTLCFYISQVANTYNDHFDLTLYGPIILSVYFLPYILPYAACVIFVDIYEATIWKKLSYNSSLNIVTFSVLGLAAYLITIQITHSQEFKNGSWSDVLSLIVSVAIIDWQEKLHKMKLRPAISAIAVVALASLLSMPLALLPYARTSETGTMSGGNSMGPAGLSLFWLITIYIQRQCRKWHDY